MAQRFSQGGHLLAFANVACATDAQHVAVVHPVIVRKCALPTLALTNDSPSAEWRGWPRWCRLYTPAWPAGPAARHGIGLLPDGECDSARRFSRRIVHIYFEHEGLLK